MSEQITRRNLERAITAARRGLFVQAAVECWVRIAPWLLVPAVVLAALDQYFAAGRWTPMVLFLTIFISLAIPLLRAAMLLSLPFRSALSIDERTHLKDRLSSAWEFLEREDLDAPTRAQISDALAHAEALHAGNLLNASVLRQCRLPLALAALFFLSFWIPARGSVAPDPAEQRRMAEQRVILEELEETLEAEVLEDEELADIIEQLRAVKSEFDTGDLGERDLMIALSRLEEALEAATADEGVAALARELDALTPQLAADASAQAVAEALDRKELQEAAEEMEALGERAGKLSEEERMSLAAAMDAAAKAVANTKPAGSDGKFMEGQQASPKNSQSFEDDLAESAESLRSSNGEGFEESSKSMAAKMQRVQKLMDGQRMREQLAMSRARLGQAGEQGENGEARARRPGDGDGEGQGAGEQGRSARGNSAGNGGLEAGSNPAGDNRGEGERMGDTAGELLKLSGQAGDGEVRTETETTAGETGESTRSAKEVHSEYQAIAEEVISREEVPLGHRLHVKRYFQEIRPKE